MSTSGWQNTGEARLTMREGVRLRLLRKAHAIAARCGLGHCDLSAMASCGSLASADAGELQDIIRRLLQAHPQAARRSRPRRRRRPRGIILLRTPAQVRTIARQVQCLRRLGFRRHEIKALARRTVGFDSFSQVRTAREASAAIAGLIKIVRWARVKRQQVAEEAKRTTA
jgi:hypothetical protein